MDMYNANKTGIFGSAGKSDVDSKYESVTDQSGIYAGKEGFDINVGENTDLKGGIISSEAEKEKNKISTGTLTYEDIKNKAEYEAGSTGINVDTSSGAEHKDAGVTPNIGVGAKDDAESTTKATVSEGEIEIRDKENQKQDLSGLNRDTKNSLNKLGEIFDKTKVEERQELAGLFGEVAFNQIHYMKGTKEQKALYHALVGGIMSKLTSGDFLAGASATAINKLVIGEIEKIAGKDPAMMQWLSAGVGSIANELIDFNRWLGASVASSATKFNELAKKPESVQLAIYYDNFIGHVSLVIDGKEVNYGRYVKNSDINSSFGMIGEGAVIIYDDFSKRKELSGNKVYVYDLKLTESEGSKLVESFVNIVDNGGYNWSDKKTSNNQSEEDLEEHLIIDEAYRFNADSPYKVYCLYKRNCTTFTMDLLKSTLGENDSRIREIQDHIAPSTVLWNIVMDKEKVK